MAGLPGAALGAALYVGLGLTALFFVLRVAARILRRVHKARRGLPVGTKVMGFYHPNAHAGGGGERVLWKLIGVLHRLRSRGVLPKLHIALYVRANPAFSTDADLMRAMVTHANQRFGLTLDPEASGFTCVQIPPRVAALLSEESWPRFTMFGQSFGSVMFALAGLLRMCPDTLVDTTGAAFIMPLGSLVFGCTCASYVHYPTISTDMLRRVYERRPAYNNASALAGSRAGSYVKLAYYCVFALAYSFCGAFSTLTMVNSRWTHGHISFLWRLGPRPVVIYPPVAVEQFTEEQEGGKVVGGAKGLGGGKETSGPPLLLEQLEAGERRGIISVGQFRPEKDHPLQLRALRKLINDNERLGTSDQLADVKLILLGSCRDADDEGRVEALRSLARDLGLEDRVEFVLNCSFGELKRWIRACTVGIHTMWNEHFGIGVVEMLAAGLVVVAHDSGGPKLDIVVPALLGGTGGRNDHDDANATATTTATATAATAVGFLASTDDDFAGCVGQALAMSPHAKVGMVQRARDHSRKFSDGVFDAACERIVVDPRFRRVFTA